MLDYLVVGAGLAGGILSHRLIEAGKKIAIIDDDSPHAAYKVAGGIWNAITFKRILKGWMADELTSEAHRFYNQLQNSWNLDFYQAKKTVRAFSSTVFQNDWLAKSNEPNYSSYLSDTCPEEIKNLPLKLPFGCGTVNHSGYVNLPVFIQTLRQHLGKKAKMLNESFSFENFSFSENNVQYKGLKAKSIIFCEGYELVNNPYFNWLPMKATKGEVLTLKNPGWKFESIFNNGKHLLIDSNNHLNVGATFEWKDLDYKCTEKAKEELLNHLKKNFLYSDWELIDQKAGIRPTVSDRRPLTGQHPKYKNLYIFNGLGTKGVYTSPWLSKMMCEHLCANNKLHPESDIRRFLKKHYPIF